MLALLCLIATAVNLCVANGGLDLEPRFELLYKQIEELQAMDADKTALIEGLTADFNARENALRAEISELRSKLEAGSDDKLRRPSRRTSQTPISFYAIAPKYDFSVMSEGQALVYGETFLNSGNAFNNATGTFIAPLRGIYVIFVTVGGNIHNSNYFYVDVNGCRMAQVLMTANGPGQGSQTVIANLNAGDAVNVRAGRYNDGAYGEYFTSIGGFLLYE